MTRARVVRVSATMSSDDLCATELRGGESAGGSDSHNLSCVPLAWAVSIACCKRIALLSVTQSSLVNTT